MSEQDNNELQRGLSERHINMIAIGGAIGTGLFVALGGSLASGGPGGVLLAYGGIGIMVFFLMTSLGEMATHLPVAGSFETYATRFIDPALGFASGVNYWFGWAMTLACEFEAAAIIMKFWFPDVSSAIWTALFFILLYALNVFSVKGYGESEFWFAGIKVVAIIVFLILGILIMFNVIGGGGVTFENWTVGDAPFPGGFKGTLAIFMIAGFSFQGTEMIGVTAGETKNPEKAIPKAVKTVFFRILIFYIGAVCVIATLIPYNDPSLLQADIDNLAVSPFTLVFQRAGIKAAAHIMNFVILTSVLSAGNTGLYGATRVLYAMGQQGKAPKWFAKVTKRGVPLNALNFTAFFGLFSFLGSFVGDGFIYLWLVNMTGMCGFVTWITIAACHWRFRRAFVAQGHDVSELKYHAALYPFGPVMTFIVCAIVICGQFWAYNAYNFVDFMGCYLGLFVFLFVWIYFKIRHHTKVVPLMEVDVTPLDPETHH